MFLGGWGLNVIMAVMIGIRACIVSTIKGPKQNREKLFWLDYFAGPPRRDGLILDKLYVM